MSSTKRSQRSSFSYPSWAYFLCQFLIADYFLLPWKNDFLLRKIQGYVCGLRKVMDLHPCLCLCISHTGWSWFHSGIIQGKAETVLILSERSMAINDKGFSGSWFCITEAEWCDSFLALDWLIRETESSWIEFSLSARNWQKLVSEQHKKILLGV